MSVKAEWLASRLETVDRYGMSSLELAEFALAELERWDKECPAFTFPWSPPNPTTTPWPMEISCGPPSPTTTTNENEVLRFHGVEPSSPWVPEPTDWDLLS